VLCQGEVVKSWRKRWLVLKQVGDEDEADDGYATVER
jgi:hypothetical protein